MGEAVQEHVHLKPQIAERTRQRKWAALRKFVCKSKDAQKKGKKTSAGTQQQSLGKAVSFLSLLATEAREGNHSSIVYTKTSRENKTGFFFRFFAFREDSESRVDVSYVWMTQKLGFEVHVTFTCKNTHKERMRAQTWSWTSLMKSFCLSVVLLVIVWL